MGSAEVLRVGLNRNESSAILRECSALHRLRPCYLQLLYMLSMRIKGPYTPPLLHGLRPLRREQVAPDVLAGVTLAALALPEVLGYTKIAGTPVITGIYTMLLPMLLYGVFGASRHLVVGADSATAAILAACLAGLGLTRF